MDKFSNQAGFTLIEMVTVIVILGLLAVVVIPRFISPSNFDLRATSDTLISSLRQAQQLAMTKAPNANVAVTTDNTNKRIRISYSEGGAQTIDVSISFNADIDDRTINFSKTGEAISAPGAAPWQIQINAGSNVRAVCIEASGYAHAC